MHTDTHTSTRPPLARAYTGSHKTPINNNACSGVSQPKQTRLFYLGVYNTLLLILTLHLCVYHCDKQSRVRALLI